jgi:hypothetical protein
VPKSKKRKKNKKSVKQLRFEHKKSAQDSEKGKTTRIRRRPSLISKLYANDCAGLYQLVIIAPFFIASWTAGGFVLDNMSEFMVLTLALLAANYIVELYNNPSMMYRREFRLLSSASIVGLLFWFDALTQLHSLTLLIGLALLMQILSGTLDHSSPRRVLLHSSTILARMCIFSLAGILTQRYDSDPNLRWEYMVFGFVPGFVLAASFVARYAQVFANNGWKKSKKVTKKKGEVIVRPAGLTQIFSLILVTGPAIPTMLTPFNHFPTPFLLAATAFYSIPKILENFLHQHESNATIGLKTANLALGMTFIVFAAGLLVRLGIY